MEHRITSRVQRIKISDTKLMPMLAARVGGCVSLGQGVPSFPTPVHALDAVNRALTEDPASGRYSLQPGRTDLRQAVADILRREKGLDANPDTEIAITVGAMEALLCAVLTLVEDGDEVLVPEPFYPSHVEQIVLAGGRPVFVPLRREDWGLDVDALRAAVTERTRAVVVNSPHNPTGAVFAESDLRQVADLALARDFYVICDDTYDFLSFDGPAFSMAEIPELREQLVAVGSFSKRFALTGWRVGFAFAPKTVMDQMLKVHDATTICAPGPSQVAALAALNGPQDLFDHFRDTLRERRELLCGLLEDMDGAFELIRPAGAFYVMARYTFTNEPSRMLAERLIREARVVTIPGGSFGPGGEHHLRMSFGGTEEDIREACRCLATWIRNR